MNPSAVMSNLYEVKGWPYTTQDVRMAEYRLVGRIARGLIKGK